METVKVTVVGDGAVGKTALLVTFTSGRFPGEYIPTIFDNYNANMIVDSKCVNLSLWDSAGQEDYDRLRPLAYPGTDCFICCFSMTDRTSLMNARNKWIPELRTHSPGTPIYLVGTKSDLKNHPKVIERLQERNDAPVTTEDAERIREEMGLVGFIETSALTLMGVKDLFDDSVRVSRRHRDGDIKKRRQNKHKPMCSIM